MIDGPTGGSTERRRSGPDPHEVVSGLAEAHVTPKRKKFGSTYPRDREDRRPLK